MKYRYKIKKYEAVLIGFKRATCCSKSQRLTTTLTANFDVFSS